MKISPWRFHLAFKNKLFTDEIAMVVKSQTEDESANRRMAIPFGR